MTQATAKPSPSISERLHWNDFIKPWIVRLVFVGLGILIGLYILAPQQARAGSSFLPSTFTDIPTGVVQFTNAEGLTSLLPIRIAGNSSQRTQGFNNVGTIALDNSFLLYEQSRETTRPSSYTFDNTRAQLELAVINGAGEVVGIQEVPLGTEQLSVTENHRWILAAKKGTFASYGIAVGSIIDPESIQKINL
jgi:uncharacterized membrane protein (UPF0127 family)